VGRGVRLAVQTFGTGPTPLVFVPGFFSHVELQWADPAYARFLASLGRFARVTVYDKRGGGASDPVASAPTLEDHVRDLHRVVEESGPGPVVVLGFSNGGAIAMSYAAAHPESVLGLVLCSTFARAEGLDKLLRPADELFGGLLDRWGEGLVVDLACPSLSGSKLARRNAALYERASLHPDMVWAIAEESLRWDLTPVLGRIEAPTLVLHRRDDYVPIEGGREVARRIPGARFVELEGGDHVPHLGDATAVLVEVEAFVRAVGADPAPALPHRTVLFTDLVGSTTRAVEVGDARWRAMREAHDDLTRAEVERHGGRAVKSTGDGWLAIFDDGPSALRAASAIGQQVSRLGLEIRAGAHTGPIELLDDGDVSGTVVNCAARVAALAGAGEVLCTDAVRAALCVAVPLRPWGVAELKGLPGTWTLHAIDVTDDLEGDADGPGDGGEARRGPAAPTASPESLAPQVRGVGAAAVAVARRVIGPVRARRYGVA